MACIAELQQRELSPNALIVQEVEWDTTLTIDGMKKNVPAGVYTVEAKFPLANFEEALVTSSVDIKIKS